MATIDWVNVVGYQHEVLHTGVLAHLLRGQQAAAVAAAVIGGLGDVAALEDVRPGELP